MSKRKTTKVTNCDLEETRRDTVQSVTQCIFLIRGQPVMFDHDLARLYGVTTKQLNQQLKRNRDCFPKDFAFQLTMKEAKELAASRSQIVTLKKGQNIKYAPHVFTEHGAIMLASVLNRRCHEDLEAICGAAILWARFRSKGLKFIMSNKGKTDSPLVRSVMAVDAFLSELERIGGKINATDMTGEFDVDHIAKLMTRFAECGQGVSDELSRLSAQLGEARARAEVIAAGVSVQAQLFSNRRKEQSEDLEKFRVLTEKVQTLNAAISQFRRPGGESLTEEDRVKLTSSIPDLQTQLTSLIEELKELRESARKSQFKALRRSAESLSQSLEAVQKKLRDLGSPA